jgi:hypothetical protein
MAQQAWLVFAKDLFAAVVWSMLGGPAGWLVFLGVVSLFMGDIPKKGDYLATPYTLIGGLLAGAVLAPIARAFVGTIRRRWLWAFGFFLWGAMVGPLALIALIAYAMSGTGGW